MGIGEVQTMTKAEMIRAVFEKHGVSLATSYVIKYAYQMYGLKLSGKVDMNAIYKARKDVKKKDAPAKKSSSKPTKKVKVKTVEPKLTEVEVAEPVSKDRTEDEAFLSYFLEEADMKAIAERVIELSRQIEELRDEQKKILDHIRQQLEPIPTEVWDLLALSKVHVS